MRWLFDYAVNFYFIYFLLHVEELTFTMDLSVMTNNQRKCGIIYEKIAMRAID